MEISITVLASMLQDAAELGAKRALANTGLIKPYISRADASRAYGKRNVDRWIKEGLITLVKDGQGSAKLRIDRIQIEAVAKANNRPSYLTVAERMKKSNQIKMEQAVISKQEAYNKYGRSFVDKCISDGFINLQKIEGKWRINKAEIEAVSKRAKDEN